MVNWEDPEIVAYVLFLYAQLANFLLGLFATHVVGSLKVEWQLLTRQRVFRLVHIPFLLARYMVLVVLLFFVISGHVSNHIACDAAYRMFAAFGSFVAMLASFILCSRPWTIFRTLHMKLPLFGLFMLALGQATLVILQGVLTVRADWNPATQSCDIIKWDSSILAAFYLYTFCFDLAIVLATLYAVRCVHREQRRRRWTLGDILCIQGIWYVVATCAVNVPVAVLATLDLNIGMDVLMSQVAMTASVMASSQALLSLEDHDSKAATVVPATNAPTMPAHASGTVSTHITMSMHVDSAVVYDEDKTDAPAPPAVPRGDAQV